MERPFCHSQGHGPTCVRPSRFHDCADLRECGVGRFSGGLADVRPVAAGPWRTDLLWRRTGGLRKTRMRSLTIVSLYTIYGVLRIS